MKLFAYAKLLNRKIMSAHKKAKNPFTDSELLYNPFIRAANNTMVWVEADDNHPTRFDRNDY